MLIAVIAHAGDTEGTQSSRALVVELPSAEPEATWQRFTARNSSLKRYTDTAEGRTFPIFRLTPD